MILSAAVASLMLAAANPVIVEAGAKTVLGRKLCAVEGDERVKLVEGQLQVPEQAVFAKLTVTAGDCAAPETLAVSVVPDLPREPTQAWLFVDDARLELHGANLARAVVWWRVGATNWKSANCQELSSDGNCGLAVTAEESQAVLGGGTLEVLRLPPGSPAAPGSQTPPELWEREQAQGPTAIEALKVAVQRLVISGPLVHATSVEAWREQNVLPLSDPGSVASVRCRTANCWLSEDRSSLVVVPPPSGEAVTVTAVLKEKVYLRQGENQYNSVSFSLPLARCQVRPLVPVVLGGTDDHRLSLALGERCPTDLAGLTVETSPPSGAYLDTVSADGKLIWLLLGHVPPRSDTLEIRLLRGATRTIIGTSRVAVRGDFTPTHIALVDPQLGEVPYIPTNRVVRLQWASTDGRLGTSVIPAPLPGYYSLQQKDGETLIRGESRTSGTVPLRFGYVVPGSGTNEPLVTFDSQMRLPIKPVNVPVSLAPDDPRTKDLFTVICRGDKEVERVIAPGDMVSLPYSSRGSCRLKVDRRVLNASDGTQRIKVSVKIHSPTGTARDGSLSQVLVLSAGNAGTAVDTLWLGSGETLRPWDHMTLAIAHDDQPGHYFGGEEFSSGLPGRRYQMVFGDARLRLYGSATVPTGLYRITRGEDGGLLQFSAGACIRLVMLDREGKEFPADFEFALLGTNLSGRADLSIVAGLGLTVPLLNPQEKTQAAIGIHAWVEYAPTRSSDPRRPFALIFGPSISLGDFGINL